MTDATGSVRVADRTTSGGKASAPFGRRGCRSVAMIESRGEGCATTRLNLRIGQACHRLGVAFACSATCCPRLHCHCVCSASQRLETVAAPQAIDVRRPGELVAAKARGHVLTCAVLCCSFMCCVRRGREAGGPCGCMQHSPRACVKLGRWMPFEPRGWLFCCLSLPQAPPLLPPPCFRPGHQIDGRVC